MNLDDFLSALYQYSESSNVTTTSAIITLELALWISRAWRVAGACRSIRWSRSGQGQGNVTLGMGRGYVTRRALAQRYSHAFNSAACLLTMKWITVPSQTDAVYSRRLS